ncbi:MAG: DUF4317 domain-containing protein [Ruminococcus sp.]|nr:DUF4317 domain-containing protein [Ruminococcus sp.]
MNKKEINEIKKQFGSDSGLFTIDRVLTAFVDAEKNVKLTQTRAFNLIEPDECELITTTLKKVLSGTVGKNLSEYEFPKDASLEGGMQKFYYEVLQSKLEDEELNKKLIETVAEKMEYVSTYALFTAHCTYSVLKKNKMDELTEESDTNYRFIITAVCPVTLRIDGLVYNEENNSIAKNTRTDRIVEMPTDGFLFPLFNDRAPDVNGVLCYTKNAKKPNVSLVEELLGCEFSMSYDSERNTFKKILTGVVGEELDYELITSVNTKIKELVDQNSHETEIPKVDNNTLSQILWESGVGADKLEALPKVYEKAVGDKPLTAQNLIDARTVVAMPSITVNIKRDGVDKVKTEMINGRRCLVIDLDDPEIEVNGFEVKTARPAAKTEEE